MLLHVAIEQMQGNDYIDNTLFSTVCGLQFDGESFLSSALARDVYAVSNIPKHQQWNPFHKLLLRQHVNVRI